MVAITSNNVMSLFNLIFKKDILGKPPHYLKYPMQSKLAFEGILNCIQKVSNAILDAVFPIRDCVTSCIFFLMLIALPPGATKRPSR